jgi:hypothetical protein
MVFVELKTLIKVGLASRITFTKEPKGLKVKAFYTPGTGNGEIFQMSLWNSIAKMGIPFTLRRTSFDLEGYAESARPYLHYRQTQLASRRMTFAAR